MSEEKNYKRKVKPGAIELDPVEPVIIVNYDSLVLDPSQPDDDGNPTVISRESQAKRMRLKTFTSKSTIQRFAEGVVEKCKYIHPSKVPHVAGLLEQLQQRLIEQEGGGDQGRRDSEEEERRQLEREREQREREAEQMQRPERPKRPPSAARTRSKPPPRGEDSDEEELRRREREQAREEAEMREEEELRRREEELRRLEEQELRQEEEQRREDERRREEENRDKGEDEAAMRERIENEMREKYEAEHIKKREEIQAEIEAEHAAALQAEKEKAEQAMREAEQEKEKAQRAAARAMEEAQAAVSRHLEEAKHEEKKGTKKDKTKRLRRKGEMMVKKAGKKNAKKVKEEKASMDNIDSYLERLYEDSLDEKIKGTSLMLQLVQDPVNLEYFIQSDTILGALSRILSEERKKSTDLITNILQIFFCFSSFTQLHPILLHNKIGDTTMRIVKLEIERYKTRTKDAKFEDDPKKKAKYLQKQERLLFVCFYILLNLAEDTNVELKMKNRDIIGHLVKMLARKNDDRKFLDELHLLIVTFLKKLSIFAENKTQMVKLGIVKYLRPFLVFGQQQVEVNEDLLEAVLRLIYNLSFDPDHREEMINQSMIPAIVETMKKPVCKQVSVRILYNVSMDFRHKEICHGALTSAVPMTTQFVIQCPNELVDQELISLAINLANDPKNIQLMVAGDGLHHMVKRVHQTHDPLLIKLLKNISSHEMFKQLFMVYLHEFVAVCVKTTNYDFLLEALGVLANINIPDVQYTEVTTQHGFLDFLMKYMVPGFAEDDVLLAVVMCVGTLATDANMAPLLSNGRLIRMLHDILTEKHEDVDIVLQLVYSVFKMLLHHSSRQAVIKHPNFTNCLLDLVIDPNEQVRNLSNLALDIIMEHDEDWRAKIREKRFEMCNREWLDFITNGGVPNFERDQGGTEFYDEGYGYMDSPQVYQLSDFSIDLSIYLQCSPLSYPSYPSSPPEIDKLKVLSDSLVGGLPPPPKENSDLSVYLLSFFTRTHNRKTHRPACMKTGTMSTR